MRYEPEDFTRGLLLDLFQNASRAWWLKRAQDFENAKPRVDEWHGRLGQEELRKRWIHCDQVARACRAKAEVVNRDITEFDALLDDCQADWARGVA